MKHRAIAWLILVLGMFFCRAWLLENVIYNIDEAEYAVEADALNHGWLPGVDLLGTTKPPGIILLFDLLFHIFGRSMAVLHVANVIIMIVAGVLLVELAVSLWGLAAAIPAAVLFWMAVNTFNLPSEMIALNVEPPGVLFALIALLVAWRRPQSAWFSLLSGIALGIALLFRQSFAAFMLPLGYIVLTASGQRVKRAIFAVVGMILPWVPVMAKYAAAGALAWTWDSWIRYPLDYAGDVGLLGFFEAAYLNFTEFAAQAAIPLAMSVGGVILLWRVRRERRTKFLYWMLGGSNIALCAGSRFFGHYWIQVWPIMALLGIPAWFLLWQGSRSHKLLLIVALFVGGGMAALHFPLWRTWDHYAPPRGTAFFHLGQESLEVKTAEFAKAHTNPDETITVWGYCPQIYYLAHRLPGTRDFLCHYITGYSPGSFDPFTQRAFRPNGHPHAEEMFIEDLKRRKPKYIFDLVKVFDYAFTFLKYSMRSYPKLADYVRMNYLPEGNIDDVLIYRRRTPEDTWWPSEKDIE